MKVFSVSIRLFCLGSHWVVRQDRFRFRFRMASHQGVQAAPPERPTPEQICLSSVCKPLPLQAEQSLSGVPRAIGRAGSSFQPLLKLLRSEFVREKRCKRGAKFTRKSEVFANLPLLR